MASAYKEYGICGGCSKSIGCYAGQSVQYYKTNGKLYHGGCSAKEYKCEICGSVIQYTSSMKYSTMSSVGHVCKKCSDNIQSAVNTYNKWGKCECGKRFGMNCAHDLHHAMIKANILGKYSTSYSVCSSTYGRLLKAKTLRSIFNNKYNKYTKTPKNGWFFCYQENSGQGHVCVVHFKDSKVAHHTSEYYGSWPIQEYYI
mmetsp:Transcript_42627/g.37859  ORF Transcript_42627/g.37859 Transcript_42627/m.37859 type:complete len:200 (-) Transcript_42627:114-713(-)